jgi:hypothetical protein
MYVLITYTLFQITAHCKKWTVYMYTGIFLGAGRLYLEVTGRLERIFEAFLTK